MFKYRVASIVQMVKLNELQYLVRAYSDDAGYLTVEGLDATQIKDLKEGQEITIVPTQERR